MYVCMYVCAISPSESCALHAACCCTCCELMYFSPCGSSTILSTSVGLLNPGLSNQQKHVPATIRSDEPAQEIYCSVCMYVAHLGPARHTGPSTPSSCLGPLARRQRWAWRLARAGCQLPTTFVESLDKLAKRHLLRDMALQPTAAHTETQASRSLVSSLRLRPVIRLASSLANSVGQSQSPSPPAV
jgi:hypothetical protein